MDTCNSPNQLDGKLYEEVKEALALRLKELLKIRGETDRMAVSMLPLVVDFDQPGVKRGMYIPAEYFEQAELRERIQEYGRTFVRKTKRDFRALFKGKEFDVWMLREMALLFLRALQNNKVCYFEVEDGVYYWLRDDDAIRIANLVTAVYLEEWLGSDVENYQTPYGFAAYPYRKEKRYVKNGDQKIADDILCGIRRANQHREMLCNMRKWQIHKEHTPLGRERRKGGQSRSLDLIKLAWCEAYMEGGLDLLKYLYIRKNIMTQVKDIRSKREEGLAAACQRGQWYIRCIHEIRTDESAPISNLRRFVSSSMMLHGMERAYGFHMYGRIAERICNKSVDYQKYSADAATVVLGRWAGTQNYLFAPLWAKSEESAGMSKEDEMKGKAVKRSKRPYVFVNERLDVLDIDFYVNHMFAVDGEKVSKIESELHWRRRHIAQDLLTFLFALYPPAQQHTWGEKDFYNATLFYRHYYPVTEEFLKVSFPTTCKTLRSEKYGFYNWFRRIYVELSRDEDGPLAQGRKYYIKQNEQNKTLNK